MKNLFLALSLIFFCSILAGCNTLKGAANGFTKDWDEAKKIDDWLQKHAW